MDIEKILDKVGEMYLKYGVKSVTMDDISHELGISKKTLYQYIEDKKDLVEKVFNQLHDKEDAKFHEFVCDNKNAIEELINVNKYLRSMIENHNLSTEYDLKKYYPELFWNLKEKKRKHMYKSVLSNLEKGIKEGLYRKELNAEYIAKYYVSRMDSNFSIDIFKTDINTIHEFISELFIYHIRGISSKKGIEFLEANIDEIK